MNIVAKTRLGRRETLADEDSGLHESSDLHGRCCELSLIYLRLHGVRSWEEVESAPECATRCIVRQDLNHCYYLSTAIM